MQKEYTNECLLKLVEVHEREKDQLHDKISQLEKRLKQKEVEFVGLSNWCKILTLKGRNSTQELHEVRLELSNRPEQESYEGLIDDELDEARKELMNGLKDSPNWGNIGVKKMMGELNFKPFLRAVNKKYYAIEAEIKALELWSLWKEYLHNSDWYPYKVITVNGESQQIIDFEDEKLKALRELLGHEVHDTVVMSLIEVNECNTDDFLPELWNFSDERKATLKEGISAIIANQMGTVKELKKARHLAVRLAKELDVKVHMLFGIERKCDELTAELDVKNRTLSKMEHKSDDLTAELDLKNQKLSEMEHKHDDNLIAQKDLFHWAFLEEIRKMELLLEVEKRKADINCRENDKLKQELDNQMQIIEQRTKEFDRKNSQNLEATSLLNEKHTLEPKNFNDDNYRVTIQIENLKKDLSDKLDDMQNLESLNQVLFVQHRICNDELQEARKEAIQILRDTLDKRTTLRIKRMGEVDMQPFQKLLSQKCPDGGDPVELSTTLCSSWQEEVGNSNWNPFKNVKFAGNLKVVIDEDDDKLKELRNECGDEVYNAVANALLELNDYNPSGRYIVSEIWYPNENRKATLKEVIQYIFKRWQSQKNNRKRKRS